MARKRREQKQRRKEAEREDRRQARKVNRTGLLRHLAEIAADATRR
jgi:hypothetical protein